MEEREEERALADSEEQDEKSGERAGKARTACPSLAYIKKKSFEDV